MDMSIPKCGHLTSGSRESRRRSGEMVELMPYNFIVRGLKILLLRLLKFLRCEYEAEKSSSLLDIIRIFICHLFFAFGRRSRLPIYDYSKNDPYNRGLLFWEGEKKLEYPIPQQILCSQGPQELLLTSVRTSGEVLVVRFVRAGKRQAEINILVRDMKGRTFSTPNHKDREDKRLLLDISHGSKFQAGGLRMQCMEPMRKWRIAFNGLLVNQETGVAAYVRFAFLWFSLSHVSDWSCDVPTKRLFEFCVDSKPKRKFSETAADLELCHEYLSGYEETGYCVGSMQVTLKDNNDAEAEEPEQELHMRGNFLRIRHPKSSKENSTELRGFTHDFTYSKKGHLLQLSSLTFNHGKSLTFGSFLSTPGFKDPIESILNDRGVEANLEDVLLAPKLTFSTFELSHELLRSEGSVLGNFEYNLGWGTGFQVSKFDALIDNIPAFGLSIRGLFTDTDSEDLLKPPVNILDFDPQITGASPLVVSLEDPLCKSSGVSGGKGSSLAVLNELSCLGEGVHEFSVPKGVVVTTEAFRQFMQSTAMLSMRDNLRKVLDATTVEDVKTVCERCMNDVKGERMPTSVLEEILQQLRSIFPDLDTKSFAVRSSCAGEDSEDMSAAGQMETFLGVKGEQQILESVVKCWASQFSHVAIEYKKRYGQELVSDMAVVIMEMVPAESAGVMFTCDPLTGDPSTIYITSNFGLGESVVSALADPDTVRVDRDISGKLTVREVVIGKKDLKIVIDAEGGGTRTESVSDNKSSSLNPTQVELLATVGASIERCYGDWRDVEWAFARGILYILQARPVTFMEKPSGLEIATDFEISSRAECSAWSKANVGEVMDGAVSPLSLSLTKVMLTVEMKRSKGDFPRRRRFASTPYYDSAMKVARYQYLFDMSEALRLFVPDPTNKAQVESMMLNLCGRLIDDDELYEDMGDKTDKDIDIPFFTMKKELIKIKYFAKLIFHLNLYRAQKNAKLPEANMTVDELFAGLCDACNLTTDYGCNPHIVASNGSSQWTSRIVEYLQDNTNESMETIYGDMSRLLASSDDVVSCEVPNRLEKLGVMIVSEIGRKKFLECSAETAKQWLKDDKKYPACAAEFQRFLEEFGHRGYNEFDIYRKPWNMDTSPLIATLQTMMRNETDPTSKKYESIFESIDGMKCKLSLWQKLRLAAIVYFARKAVGARENTKSLWIWTQNSMRKWAFALASKMKQEGRLPDEELLFFCTTAEIHELICDRNPSIISRAFDRKRLFPELASQQFREYFRGIPRPAPDPLPVFEDGVVQMKGFPISKGRIQAKARVINKLRDAEQIQKGEILITYATDIGWSPYFPMLGGVVTELGGLMSHGAVVAREYGLPCVVGLLGATKVFRSGDTVLLDGARGMLIRIEEAA